MLKDLPLELGDWLSQRKQQFWNRTGATLNKGQLAMIDILKTQGETTTIATGDEASVFSNVTPVTQTSYENGFPVVVCDDDTIADNAKGWFWICGPRVPVSFADQDVSTNDITAAGLRLGVLVSDTGGALAVCLWATGAAAGNRQLGISLEAAAADSNDTDRKIDANSHRRDCIWYGGVLALGSDT